MVNAWQLHGKCMVTAWYTCMAVKAWAYTEQGAAAVQAMLQ